MLQQATAFDPEIHSRVSRRIIERTSGIPLDPDCFFARQDTTHYALKGEGLIDLNDCKGSYCLGVVAHPELPELVYKLCTSDPAVDPYILYAEWVYENRLWETNAHFPRIFDITYTSDGQVALVSMERLDELIWDEAEEWIKQDYYLSKKFIRETDRRDYEADERDDSHTNRPLENASRMVVDQFGPAPYRFDLHKGNVMVRQGFTVVILDPLAL